MAKRELQDKGSTEHRVKKKSKTEKRTKKTEDAEASTETQHTDSNELSPADLEKFFSENSVKVTDTLEEAAKLHPIISFSRLPACDSGLYRPLDSFTSPTAIQSVTWPFLFAGRDVIGIAETGSGKTLGFGLPCLKRILDSAKKGKGKPYMPTAVIISPTRELAMQIYDQILKFAELVDIKVACIFGGVKKDEQREALKTATIVVATPGRLKDLQNDGSVDLGKVKYLVLDEADRMLDKGFEQDIKDIIRPMPVSKRQTVMFTATWPPVVRNLAATFMTSPVTVTIGGEPSADPRANTRIKQVVEVVKPQEKEQRLVQLLNKYQKGPSSEDKILVFCLYKKEAVRVERLLWNKGFKVAGIHGDLGQQERFKSLDSFKKGVSTILVATDVAARGLDIPSVKLVINVTFPLTVEDYVHRIGRTGRAGAEGHAITLFTEVDKAQSGALINVLKAAKQEVPEDLLKFGATVKKKQHDAYGAFFKDVDTNKTSTKIVFDD
ncbi:RNA-dependent ATPase DBP3 [Aspergillus ibericus CBS 121593]|uniref:RNA helicase n=1 Tax=Aspergillus ibericus CBS 121593 TaxID=1448316 RepID=A0A395HBV5_9EURO|nr:DEAD-domain-containing protein [Aspergillus ibericus CBS 121593]RAL05029.1 DEAD-domain-containing protein [Aspergillus ibericus CBS 121593]